jgi:hypothetical protein
MPMMTILPHVIKTDAVQNEGNKSQFLREGHYCPRYLADVTGFKVYGHSAIEPLVLASMDVNVILRNEELKTSKKIFFVCGSLWSLDAQFFTIQKVCI